MKIQIDKNRYKFWEWYLKEFKQDCKNRLLDGPQPFKHAEKAVYSQILFSLIHNLDAIITPTIVCYINQNKLKNSNSVYNDLFSGSYERTLEILEKFHSPTFINIIHRYRRFKTHFYKITERIFGDWEVIKSKFMIQNYDKLTSIKLTCGDEHFYGGQTSILHFGTGTKGFVYKPTGINLDLLIQELRLVIDKTERNIIISKDKKANEVEGDYGYIGLLQYVGEVKNLRKAQSLYKDFGNLLALGRFFKIADGHCDNIIISNEGVQWIDLEAAFHFTQDSVYEVHPLEETGLIYEAKPENTFIGIITGIQGGSIPRLALTSPVVYNDGTDEMYIRYFKTFIPTDCYNRFSYNGSICNPENFIKDIKYGYIESIKKLYNKREIILKYIEQFFTTRIIRSRYLLQTTASYCRFVGLLNHIVAIYNNGVLTKIRHDREKTFIGKEKNIKDFMLDNEILDMVNGVIPYFYRTNQSCCLYHASGAFRDNFFNKTLFQSIEEHIMSIKVDNDTLKDDCNFIDKAINSTAGILNFEDFKTKFNFAVFEYDKKLDEI